jgi:transposase
LEELNAAARKAAKGRVATRILMIRDIQSGKSRTEVREQYAVSKGNLNGWIIRYNAEGLKGLEDRPRAGAPCKLSEDQRNALRTRLLKQPDVEKDGVVRWRVRDVQNVLQKEFEATYSSEQGVSRLMKSLGLARLTTRPAHPQKKAEEAEDFKKNSPAY